MVQNCLTGTQVCKGNKSTDQTRKSFVVKPHSNNNIHVSPNGAYQLHCILVDLVQVESVQSFVSTNKYVLIYNRKKWNYCDKIVRHGKFPQGFDWLALANWYLHKQHTNSRDNSRETQGK